MFLQSDKRLSHVIIRGNVVAREHSTRLMAGDSARHVLRYHAGSDQIPRRRDSPPCVPDPSHDAAIMFGQMLQDFEKFRWAQIALPWLSGLKHGKVRNMRNRAVLPSDAQHTPDHG